MLSLGDVEVDFIEHDLKSRGIVSEDLRDDLLDHICCIIESELSEKADFYEYYKAILPRFFKKELSEIQNETDNLLRFKHFYTMKKILKISGIATVILVILGSLFKSFHLQGAGILVILGSSFFSLVYLPLLIILKLKDDTSKIDKLIHSFGLVLAIFLTMGVLFKVMQWPYANNLMFYSTLLFTFLFVPLYFITRYRRPELKFNTTVNSVLMIAVGGIFYSMFDMSYSRKYEQLMVEDHLYHYQNAERLSASNQRLLERNHTPAAKDLHMLSEDLSKMFASLADNIQKSRSTSGVLSYMNELDEKVHRYNLKLQELGTKELNPIGTGQFQRLNEINNYLAMEVLTRAQQQVALNETCFLIASLNKNIALE